MTPGKPSDGSEKHRGCARTMPHPQRANLIRIKRGVRVPVAARDELLHPFRQLVARYPMVRIGVERREPFDQGGGRPCWIRKRRRPDRNEHRRAGTTGACAAAAATPISMAPVVITVRVTVLTTSSLFHERIRESGIGQERAIRQRFQEGHQRRFL